MAWNLKRDSSTGTFSEFCPVFLKTFFTESLRVTALADSSILTKVFYPLITLYLFFPSFICLLLKLLKFVQKVYKNKGFPLFFAIVYPKININAVKTTLPQQ